MELNATVGAQGLTGIAQIRFRIFRDGREIFHTRQGIESAGSEQFYTVTFQAIDTNVPVRTHTYKLRVDNVAATTTAQVVGPISYSALAVRRV